jgi:dolichyl-phosphate-mannose--protein O-mannosyl transferase
VDEGGKYFGVVAMGNPLLWWASVAALVAAPVVAIARGRTTLLGPAVLVAAVYFPWFAATRTSFLFYMTPVAPFLAILVAAALAAAVGEARFGRFERRVAFLLGAVAFAGAAIAWYPVGRLFWYVFWELPGRVAPGLAVAVTSVGIVAGAALVALIGARQGSTRARLWATSIALGAITGIVVAFLPIVLNIGIEPERFYRLIWFPSWI